MLRQQIAASIDFLVDQLSKDQYPDGSWRYPFETGINTDYHMIILLRTLELNDEQLIKGLVARILGQQQENGSWKLFYDEEDGNLDTTIGAYFALVISGYKNERDPEIQKAKQFILENGGIAKATLLMKVLLAIIGVVDWPRQFPVPVEVMLVPVSFPLDIYDISIYARSNLIPILVLADKKFKIKMPQVDGLIASRSIGFDLADEWNKILNKVEKWLDTVIELPDVLHEKSLARAEKYMLDRIEPDGTFYSYFSSTFYMVYALLARGYKKEHPVIQNAVQGLKNMSCKIDGMPHIQYTTATVWNTALISVALQEAGVDYKDSMLEKANQYLLTKQQVRFGDWAIHNRNTLPGGWGFSESNTMNPDVDDSTATLRAIRELVKNRPLYRHAWDRGVNWVLSMQNDDGGWPAFERDVDKKLLELVPIPEAKYLLLDPSTADLTGRTLEFLGNYTMMNHNHRQIKKAVGWLVSNQEEDGSWYGRWGICYIYGTWAALTGMAAVGVPAGHPAVKKAVKWLESIQNKNGGWGESCNSDKEKKYLPLGISTLTQTAWALEALIAVCDEKTEQIERGIRFLTKNLGRDDWTTDYPKGQGLAGAFYMHYHSYRYIWPLITLSKYRKKFG